MSDLLEVKLFNTPIEIGLRSLVLLNVCPSNYMDIQRLMYLDFLCLNTADLGGPTSLHAPIPNRGVQVFSRKELIKKGLTIMLSKELVDLYPNEYGFTYRISDAGKYFLTYFQTKYFIELVERVEWIGTHFGDLTNGELGKLIDSNLQRWGSEFITPDRTTEL